MSPSIDTTIIRTLSLEELPLELQSLQLKLSDGSLTWQLLDAVECGSISVSVFGVWLGFCKSSIVIQQALRQKISIRIRHLGIKQLRSGLESSRWEQIWEGLGGTAGLLDILSDLSVEEVKAACKAINRLTCNGDLTRMDTDLTRKRARVTDLFKGLHPNQFPDALIKTHDLRPLTEYYQLLVPSCTAEIIVWITSAEQDGRWQFVKERDLLKHHSETIGKVAIHNVFDTQLLDTKSKDRLQKLSRQYPPSSSSKHEFSASMVFALSLLRRIVETDAKDMEDSWVVANLIRPLLRRAIRKRVAWSQNQQIVDLAVQFFERRPGASKHLNSAKWGVFHMVVICWSGRSGLFETYLKRLMGMVFDKKTPFEDFTDLLARIPRSRRYAYLHMCCLETIGLDLESKDDLSKLRGVLQYYMLYALEADQALGLFQRLRRARGDANLVSLGPWNSVLSTRRTQVAIEGDPEINLLVLLNRTGLHEEAENYAIGMLDIRRKAAQTSANRETRAEQALSVWACANASGSIKLLRHTLQWAKRFIRDQLTASKLFSAYYEETYRLLSGFPVHGISSLKSPDLRHQVEAANAFMMDMIEVAREALREPSFRPGDWRKMIESFTQIIRVRIELSARWKRETMHSDEDIYSSLWEDTVAMLLRAERVLNSEDYEKLGAATISGLVDWTSVSPRMANGEPEQLDESTWRFINAVAEERDRLWTELRPHRYPDVLTLPSPFPRGLPVQQLLALWSPNVLELNQVAPYVSSRVQETLFPDPKMAIQQVEVSNSLMPAIGYFVDSYNYALTMYIPRACDQQVKQARLLKAWNHAIGPLSSGRMDTQEAIRFWKPVIPSYLQSTLVEIYPSDRSISWRPAIPTFDEPSQPQDWNPLEGRPSAVKVEVRQLDEPTYIDFCTNGQQAKHIKAGLGAFHDAPRSCIPAEYHSAPSLWYPSEAFTLAALLVLDAKYGTTDRLLMAPFPSSRDVRFPCVFLGEEFLSSDEVTSSDAASYVMNNLVDGLADIPLPLVRQITATLVDKLDAKSPPQALEAAALGLLNALAHGDRPGLAFELAIKVIMERSDASSWHRVLFNTGFLQRVPASDARAYIKRYAGAIAERLEVLNDLKLSKAGFEQADATEINPSTPSCEGGASQLAQPIIKVTTLKSLAQLLRRSTYISDDVSLEILLDLSKKAMHIDVRVSILRTLLSKLEANRPELWYSVLTALESFIALASRLDERQPSSPNIVSAETNSSNEHKTRQSNAIDKPSVPVMQTTTKTMWQDNSPMLGAFLEHFEKLEGGQLWQLYMDRIMVPLTDALTEQTAKWTALFLTNFAPECIDFLESGFPFVPKGSHILQRILSSKIKESNHIPCQVLSQLSDYLIFRINPPAWVRTLHQRLEDDFSLKSLPEVETWLTLYGSDRLNPAGVLPYRNIRSFDKSHAGEHFTHITRDFYKETFVKVFKELLIVDGPEYSRLSAHFYSVDLAEDDDGVGRSTIAHLIACVDNLRTRDWEENPDRSPAVLPDTFKWRLELLAYPDHITSDSDEAREESSKGLARQLAALIDEISGSVYHKKLEQIKERLEEEDQIVLTALFLGDISKSRLSGLTMPELLKVDLATEIILQSRGRDIGTLGQRVRKLLGTWTASENQDVRRTGHLLRGQLFSAEGEWQRIAPSTSWW